MQITIIDCGSSRVPEIKDKVLTVGANASVIKLDDACASDLNRSDGVVISGGPLLFTDPATGKALISRFGFLDQLQVPVLGICLGHQAIGLRYGAEVFRDTERRKSEEVKIEKDHPLFNGFNDAVEFTTDHCEGITLPDGFVRLASSKYYGVEAMADDSKQLYGVQFHPESSGETGEKLFQNFCNILKKQK